MRLKRIYHQDKLKRDEQGNVVEVLPGAVAGVKVLRAAKVHHFSESFILGGIREGWLELEGDRLTLHDLNEPALTYFVLREPGYYCCHCGKKLRDGEATADVAARLAHVAEHGGEESPDPNNPAGYRRDHSYTCVLDGDPVNKMTPEEAAQLERQVKQALHDKIRGKVEAARARALAKHA